MVFGRAYCPDPNRIGKPEFLKKVQEKYPDYDLSNEYMNDVTAAFARADGMKLAMMGYRYASESMLTRRFYESEFREELRDYAESELIPKLKKGRYKNLYIYENRDEIDHSQVADAVLSLLIKTGVLDIDIVRWTAVKFPWDSYLEIYEKEGRLTERRKKK